MKYESEVRNGVVLLNDRLPDWAQHIDWDELDVSDPEWCILGQIRKALPGCDIWAVTGLRGWGEVRPFGFDLPLDVAFEEFRPLDVAFEDFRFLNEAWQTWAQQEGLI